MRGLSGWTLVCLAAVAFGPAVAQVDPLAPRPIPPPVQAQTQPTQPRPVVLQAIDVPPGSVTELTVVYVLPAHPRRSSLEGSFRVFPPIGTAH